MKRVTDLGGVFFKSKDPEKTKAWYDKHLGISSGEYGGGFHWREAGDPDKKGFTAWSVFDEENGYFNPSEAPFMLNYRVKDLEVLLETLQKEDVQIVGEMEEYSYGKFGWIMDPDGRKIELWEPGEGFDEEQ